MSFASPPASAVAPAPADIAIDQVGYRIDDPKDFRVARSASSFEILDHSGRVVFRGGLNGPIHDRYAAADVWRGEFTALKTPGTSYTIRLADGTLSWPFAIGDDVYRELVRTALRGLYVSRCGYAVKDESVGHPPCHLQDGGHMLVKGEKIPDSRDVTGGWHNGGDYRRSTMSAGQAVSRILWAVELCGDALDAVPSALEPAERFDARSDLLAEAKWGLDWLAKLQYSDGGVSIGLGPEEGVMPGRVAPQDDTLHNYIGAVYSANTAKVGAVFAKAARVFKRYDAAQAQSYLARATACWGYLQQHPDSVAPPTCQTYQHRNDGPDRLWIAVELFRTTGGKQYHDSFLKGFAELPLPYPPAPINTQTIRNYNLHEALISYCFAPHGGDASVRGKILAGLRQACDELTSTTLSEGYGCVLTAENWKQRHTVGNALQMAWELLMASELTGDAKYRQAALQQLHFVLGMNPLGKVFVTGVGANPVRTAHYRPYAIRQLTPPGLLVKGPTNDAQFLAKNFKGRTPPPERAYLDAWGTHWCNEPDVEVQGHLIGLAACFHCGSRNRAVP